MKERCKKEKVELLLILHLKKYKIFQWRMTQKVAKYTALLGFVKIC